MFSLIWTPASSLPTDLLPTGQVDGPGFSYKTHESSQPHLFKLLKKNFWPHKFRTNPQITYNLDKHKLQKNNELNNDKYGNY